MVTACRSVLAAAVRRVVIFVDFAWRKNDGN